MDYVVSFVIIRKYVRRQINISSYGTDFIPKFFNKYMNTIKLNISRDKAFVGAAMPYRVIINGTEVGKIKIGGSMSCDIPNTQSTLKISMVGNSMTFHNIEKEVVLFPQYCKSGVINCKIVTKFNWLGYLTLGLLQAIGRTELDIEYC